MIILIISLVILACLLIGENILLIIIFNRVKDNLKKEMSEQFIKSYQQISGRKLTLKEQQKLYNQLVSEKMKK